MPETPLQKIFDVKASMYGATGDSVSDDTVAIQKALDDAAAFANTNTEAVAVVFVPKGFYRLSHTLTVQSEVKGTIALVGTARHLTVFQAMSGGLTSDSDATDTDPLPLLHVAPGNGRVVLTMFILVTWEHLNTVFALKWENMNTASIYRQNWFYRISECYYGSLGGKRRHSDKNSPNYNDTVNPNTPFHNGTIPCTKDPVNMSHPLSVISGSGRFHNFENEDFLYEAPSYRHLVLNGSKNLWMYQLNLEHASSEANFEIVNSENIRVYGFKTEPSWQSINHGYPQAHNPSVGFWVRDSKQIEFYSFGGNVVAMKPPHTYPSGFAQYYPSVLRIENTCPLRLSNAINFMMWGHAEFAFIFDGYHGVNITTGNTEKPSLYVRDSCE